MARARGRKKAEAAAGEFDDLRICTIRHASDLDELDYFSSLAIAENPTNASAGFDQVIADGILIPVSMAGITRKKWQNGRTIGVHFLNGTSQQQQFVGQTVTEWSKHANISFNFNVTRQASDLRITFQRGGAWSYLGTDNLGIAKTQPTMQLGWVDKAVVLHEFGHALFLIHEHQHPEGGIPWNKAAVNRFYAGPPNNWNQATINTNIYQNYGTDTTQYSAYDRRSIMHYSIPAELLTDPSRAVPFNGDLSPMDREWIGRFYPKTTAPPPPPPPPSTWSIRLEGPITLTGTGQRPTFQQERNEL